jgi:anti-sigma factor RsiW
VTDEEFCSLLDELGSDPARWPAASRTDAEALLARSPKARADLKAMQAVERLLARPAPAFDGTAVAARASQARQASRPLLSPALRKVSFAALGVASLAAGILVGMTPPNTTAIVGSVQMALNGGGSDVQ